MLTDPSRRSQALAWVIRMDFGTFERSWCGEDTGWQSPSFPFFPAHSHVDNAASVVASPVFANSFASSETVRSDAQPLADALSRVELDELCDTDNIVLDAMNEGMVS